MQFERTLGFDKNGDSISGNRKHLIQYINLKLAAKGYPVYGSYNKKQTTKDKFQTNNKNSNSLFWNKSCIKKKKVWILEIEIWILFG